MTGGNDGVDRSLADAAGREDAGSERRREADDPPAQPSDDPAADGNPGVPEAEEPGLIGSMRGM